MVSYKIIGGTTDPEPSNIYTDGTYTATGHAGYGGTIVADQTTGEFTVTATVDNYVIDEIVIDGVALTPEAAGGSPQGKVGYTYTFDEGTVGESHSIVVSFAHTVNFPEPTNGTLSVSRGNDTLTSGTIVRDGEVLTITATPDDGYTLDGACIVVTGLERIEGTDTYTVLAPRGEATPHISVSFVSNGYVVNVAALVNGSITPSAPTAAEGETVTLTVVPAQGYRLVEGSLGYFATVDGPAAIIPIVGGAFMMPAYDVTVTASFEEAPAPPVTSNVTVSTTTPGADRTGGTVTANPRTAVAAGTTVTLTVAPITCYRLIADSLKVNAGDVALTRDPGDANTYTFTMPASTAVVTAEFEAIPYAVSLQYDDTRGTVTAPATAVRDTATSLFGRNFNVDIKPNYGYYATDVAYSFDGGATWRTTFDSSTAIKYTIRLDATNQDLLSVEDGILVKVDFLPSTTLEIGTLDEFLAFRDVVNANDPCADLIVRLTEDIDLGDAGNWVPIKDFGGIFDGDGHTLSGLGYTGSGSGSLFGNLTGATVENLTVRGAIVSTGTGNYAGISAGSTSATIRNCDNYVSISAPNSTYVGGILAFSMSANSITDCNNYASLSGKSFVGGIVGINDTAIGATEILRCGNYAAIENTGSAYAGGIAGNSTGTITQCFNKGSVRGQRAAGILAATSRNGTQIVDCYNTGTITGYTTMTKRDSEPCVAGIYGFAESGISGVVLTNCYNTGTLVKTGTFNSTVTRYGEITPVKNVGGNDYSGYTEVDIPESVCRQVNCYASAALAAQSDAPAALGGTYKADTKGVNANNTPLLVWESEDVSAAVHRVGFTVIGADDYAVTVYTDDAKTQTATANGDGGYSLPQGSYPYVVTADGYMTVTGTVQVLGNDVDVPVVLTPGVTVTFTVTPADAALSIARDGNGITASVVDGATHVYTLSAGTAYTYTATAEGYNGETRQFEAADGGKIAVLLTESSRPFADGTVRGGEVITVGGVYRVERNASAFQGVITVATAEPVTLVGYGVAATDVFTDLFIDCTEEGASLTLWDISMAATMTTHDLVNFTGVGNTLSIEGVNLLEYDAAYGNYAVIHVGATAEVTVNGEGTLYFYKNQAGAGIGGHNGEASGRIIFDGATVFGKGSKQGAVIGTGANDFNGTPGDIVFRSGEYVLIANARGALIGGGAGSNGAAPGGNVYIEGGTLTLNVDYTGAAIGGGGFNGGNDSTGGNLYVSGGSVRTFIDHNAVVGDGGPALWPGVTEAGVNDAAITAVKLDGTGDAPVHLLAFDTSLLSKPATEFSVTADGFSYTGGLHRYKYVNENLQKASQIPIDLTVANWNALIDPNLYLYLTEAEQTLTVNGEAFTVEWDTEAVTFTVTPALEAPDFGAPGSGDFDGDGNTTIDEALLLVQFINNDALGTLSPGQFAALDINGDGELTMADALLIVQIILKAA